MALKRKGVYSWNMHQRPQITYFSTYLPVSDLGQIILVLALCIPATAVPSRFQVIATRDATGFSTQGLCPKPSTLPVAPSQGPAVERLKQRLKWESSQGEAAKNISAPSPGGDCLVRSPSGDTISCAPLPDSCQHPVWCDTSGSVLSLNFSGCNLQGSIPPILSNLSSLQSLDLSFNNLTGSIPPSLSSLTSLTQINLAYSGIQGRMMRLLKALPTSLWHLDLSGNPQINGSIDQVTRFTELTFLSLADTSVSGPLPLSFSALENLKNLNLSRTSLDISLEELFAMVPNLVSFDLANIRLLPPTLSAPSPKGLGGGSNSTGSPPPPPVSSVLAAAPNPAYQGSPNKRLIGVIAVGASSMLLLVAAIVGLVCLVQRRRDSNLSSGRFEKEVVKLTFKDIQKITHNFNTPLLADSMTNPKAHKGTLHPSGQAVVVEKSGTRSKEDLQAVLKVASSVQHANMVRLLGYCSHGEDNYLVSEFVALGSLESLLKSNPGLLTWTRRLKIAAGAALALDFLHTSPKVPIIHGNLTPASIFVTESFCAKVGEVGLFQQQGQSGRRSPGYIDDAVLGSGEATPRIDVYSFGVVLLELATGLQVFEDGEHITQTVAKVAASSQDGAVDLMPSYLVWDERNSLGGGFSDSPDAGVQRQLRRVFEAMLALAFMCCQPDSSKRPNMRTVADWLEQMAGGRVKRELRLNITRIAEAIEIGGDSGRSTPVQIAGTP